MIIGTNFKLSSAKFLDDRQLCKDYNTLITNAEGIIYPPGFEVFCEYENKYYQYVLGSEDEYIWEERRSGVSDGESASIKDDTISENYTWSSAHIDSMRIDLETLITQANDYTDEIDERVLYIEGKLQWFENFDGSYESLTNKPIIPEKISELEDDIDIEGLKNNSHTHINKDILEIITEEMVNNWNNNVNKIENYNDLFNKPIENIGIDIDLALNPNDLNKNIYLIKGIICGIQFTNELCIVEPNETKEDIKIIMLNSMKKIVIHKENEDWSVIEEENYGIDKNNAKISNSLNIGEGNIIKENNQIVQGKFNEEDVEEKYINIIGNGTSEEDRKNIHTLDWEGNGWYGGKLSQEGVPSEDKDLITKGYADNKYETIANVNSIVDTVNTHIENINTRIDNINKENARRDVIIEALANGRKRTVETDGNDVDLMFSTEKDKVWIDKIEGETLVNVCDQEEPIAITKSYTVEGTNHVPLQGEYDGKARPVVHGNTLVNHNIEYDRSLVAGKKVEREGTEILNLEGTVNSELEVKLEGHTAINLSTKKEDVLCKSFDSASGNEINLVAEENSVSDLVIQGNTMVNLANIRVTNFHWGDRELLQELKPNTIYTFVVNISNPTIDSKYFIGILDKNDDTAWSCLYDSLTLGNNIFTMITNDTPLSTCRISCMVAEAYADFDIMIFEGDLTQTPELIPTEYVEGLQSTFEDKLIPYSIYNGNQLTSITETQYQLPLTVKPNTQYTITTTANTTKYQYAVYSTDGLTEYLSYNTTATTQTFTCNTSNVYFKVRMNPSYEGDDYSFVLNEVKDKFLIVEGDWSGRLDLLTEGYFGKYRVDMSSHSKNLFDENLIEQGGLNFFVGSTFSTTKVGSSDSHFPLRCRTSKLISVKKNTNYTIKIPSEYAIGVHLYNNGIAVSDSGWKYGNHQSYYTFNTNNCDALALCWHINNQPITPEEIIALNIQLEEGTQATPYEPYYGSSKTVYLNSPLLDGDELLTKDGKLYHYHKMGKVVLDGSEDWTLSSNTFVNCLRCDIRGFVIPNNIDNSELNLICDRLLAVPRNSMSSGSDIVNDGDFEHITHSCINVDDYYLSINVLKSKLSTTDLNGFKQWLSENPTTVVYELAEPWYEPIGVYGKVVLDGSEEWNVTSPHDYNVYYFTPKSTGKLLSNNSLANPVYSDKLTTRSDNPTHSKQYFNSIYTAWDGNICMIYNDLGLAEFKQWLKENPVTVIYELANPQYIDEDTRFNIASTSTIEYQSNVPMANTQFLPYRNELPLLVSSTEYRVKFDCDVEGLELMVSLGGTSQTITSGLHNELSFITPSLQTDGKLTIDGYGIAKIDNVLITKGDMEYKYFEGLKSGFEDGYLPNSVLTEFPHLELGNINSNTGENMSDPTIVRTPLLTATSDKITFAIVNANYALHKVILYDDKGNFVTGNTEYMDYSKLGVATVPEGCSQFRLCLRASDVSIINQSNLFILEGDWTHLTEEDFNHLGTYKANIRIQNPNAPIFGKGGRL